MYGSYKMSDCNNRITISDKIVKTQKTVVKNVRLSCTICYEPYEKKSLTSLQTENVFRAFCRCLKINSENTAFYVNRGGGADFPLCECCSEFSLELLILFQRLKATQNKIRGKVEEVVETIIESELARKEKILKIQEYQLEEIAHDRRVDSFRKQVIKACEDVDISKFDFEEEKEQNKVLESIANAKIKKEIVTEDLLSKTDCENNDTKSKTESFPVIKQVDRISISKFKQPDPVIWNPNIKIGTEPLNNYEKNADKDASNNTVSSTSVVKVEINDIFKSNHRNEDEDDFLTLNYNGMQPEDNEDSNETTVFTKPQTSFSKFPFERIFKTSPSDDESQPNDTSLNESKTKIDISLKRSANVIEPDKMLNNNRFTCTDVKEKNGKFFVQNVEIQYLNKDKTRIKCGKCSTISKSTKAKSAIRKIRMHIVTTHLGVYKCSVCDERCRDNFNLRSHMKIHQYVPEENFTCQFCQNTCGSMARLRAHIEKKHNSIVAIAKPLVSTRASAVTPITLPISSSGDKRKHPGRRRKKKRYKNEHVLHMNTTLSNSKLCTHNQGRNSSVSKAKNSTFCLEIGAFNNTTLPQQRKEAHPRKQNLKEQKTSACMDTNIILDANNVHSVPPSTEPYEALNFIVDSDFEEDCTDLNQLLKVSDSINIDPLFVDGRTHEDSPPQTPTTTNPKQISSTKSNKIVPNSEVRSCAKLTMRIDNDDVPTPIITNSVSRATLAGTRKETSDMLTTSLNQSPHPAVTVPRMSSAETSSRPIQTNTNSRKCTFTNMRLFKVASVAANRLTTYPRRTEKATSVWKQSQNTFETPVPKLVEVVSNRNVNCGPVAVLSDGTIGSIRCGSCGHKNTSEYSSVAAALRSIKNHIYQQHFSLHP